MRYEVVGRGKAPQFFQVNSVSGKITVANDLTNELDTKYEVYFIKYFIFLILKAIFLTKCIYNIYNFYNSYNIYIYDL